MATEANQGIGACCSKILAFQMRFKKKVQVGPGKPMAKAS
jgi:hypothetical protein